MTGSTRIKASFGLIEHLLLGLSSDSWKHFMNPWIIIGLKHYACLSGVHFINAQRSVGSSSTIVCSSLFSHPVSHEKCLVCFLCAQPMKKSMINNMRYTYIPLTLCVGDWLCAPLNYWAPAWWTSVSARGLFVMACLSIPFCLKLDIMSASLACAVDSVLFFWILFICSRYFLVAGLSFAPNPSCVWRGLASDLDT